MSFGVVVGADAQQQELLPWWWINYKLHNKTPLAIADFGMDETYSAWCKERAPVISLKNTLGKKAWFKKPGAILHSPFDTTLWIDADCLVREDISPLFDLELGDLGLAMAEEPDFITNAWQQRGWVPPCAPVYNSGVVLMKKSSSLLIPWVQASEQGTFRGDQEALSTLLFTAKKKPVLLPKEYNWLANTEKTFNKHAHILHMTGSVLKAVLKMTQQKGLCEMEQTFTL